MFKENKFSGENEQYNKDIEDAINAYKTSEENLKKAKDNLIASQITLESKSDFLNRVYGKYKTHVDILMSLDNYRHMHKDVDRLLNFYGQLHDNLDNKDFDSAVFEKELDTMIAENLNKIEVREKAKAQDDANFKRDLDNLFSTFLKK